MNIQPFHYYQNLNQSNHAISILCTHYHCMVCQNLYTVEDLINEIFHLENDIIAFLLTKYATLVFNVCYS